MDLARLALTAVCLGCGAFVQSALGFGMGVVAIPLLVFAGQTLPEAIAALLPNVLIHTSFSCWRSRQDLPWADALRISVWRYLGLPVGIGLLGFVSDQGQNLTRAMLGIGLLGVLLVQQFSAASTARHPPQRRPPSSAGGAGRLAGIASGFFAGLIGMGGPPLVLWVMGHDWNSRRQRSFLWLSFLLLIPVQLILMSYRFGRPWLQTAAYGLAAVPVVLAVAWITDVWTRGLSKRRLRQITRLFLLVVAVRLIWQWTASVSS